MRIFRPADFGVGVRLAATASYLPERVVANADLVAEGAPLSEEEILRLTGIRTRHRAAPGEATSDLAIEACRRALAGAAVRPSDVDRLVLGTVSPDHPSPSTACAVQHALGLGRAPALDVSAACTGFVYALDVAARALATGDSVCLAADAEIRSRYVNVRDRATCALFGDGAAAAVLVRGPVNEGLVAIGTLAEGSGVHSVYVPAGGTREPTSAGTVAAGRHWLLMADGPAVYLQAVDGMIATAEGLLQALGMTLADVDLVVPHQPNKRLLDRLARLAGLPADKLFVNVDRVGNTSGAACAIALDEAIATDRAPAGSTVLLVAAGAGYTAGAALLRVDAQLVEATKRARTRLPGGEHT